MNYSTDPSEKPKENGLILKKENGLIFKKEIKKKQALPCIKVANRLGKIKSREKVF